MNSTLVRELPAGLIRALFESDRDAAGRTEIPPGGRETAVGWLRRVLVDFDAMGRHLTLLQQLYGEPLAYPRPHPALCGKPKWRLPEGSTKYPHRTTVPDDRIVALADDGPDALHDDELATVLLNPVALLDLFRVIGELNPESWAEALIGAGQELSEAVRSHQGGPEPVDRPGPARLNIVGEADRQRNGAGIAAHGRRFSGAIAAGVAAALVAGIGLSTAVAVKNAEQMTVLRLELERLKKEGKKDLIVASSSSPGVIEFHGDHPDRPANWENIWDANYLESAPPSENVDRIYRAAGDKVKAFIDGLRARKFADFEILTTLKQTYGTSEIK